MIQLTKIEKRAIELYHLGGVEAWRCNGNNIRSNTVNGLMKKGYFDSKGLTEKGKQYIEEHVAL